jgi:hypothetical protein
VRKEETVQGWPKEIENEGMICRLPTEPEGTTNTDTTFKVFQNIVFVLDR